MYVACCIYMYKLDVKTSGKLSTKQEPDHAVDKYAVCLKKNVISHCTFATGKLETLLKLFYFFRQMSMVTAKL